MRILVVHILKLTLKRLRIYKNDKYALKIDFNVMQGQFAHSEYDDPLFIMSHRILKIIIIYEIGSSRRMVFRGTLSNTVIFEK